MRRRTAVLNASCARTVKQVIPTCWDTSAIRISFKRSYQPKLPSSSSAVAVTTFTRNVCRNLTKETSKYGIPASFANPSAISCFRVCPASRRMGRIRTKRNCLIECLLFWKIWEEFTHFFIRIERNSSNSAYKMLKECFLCSSRL
jgi:hypothetical protein